jgi:hypothetical protein
MGIHGTIMFGAGIAAIILGAVAVHRIGTKPRLRGRGMALTGLSAFRFFL